MIHKCPICFEVTRKKIDIFDHFSKKHDIKIESESLQFKSMEECMLWKENIEKTTCSKYIKKRGPLKVKHYTQHFYQCHRSGNYVFKGAGLRRLKAVGSNKINGVCPAGFNIFQMNSGRCEVVFQKTHVGHNNKPLRLNLSSAEKDFIIERLKRNVSFPIILREAKEYAREHNLDRLGELTNKQLHNIKHGLDRSLRNTYYELSVEEVKFVPQGEHLRDGDGLPNSSDQTQHEVCSNRKEVVMQKFSDLINSPKLTSTQLDKIEDFLANFEYTVGT